MKPLLILLDGPLGAGKTTTAKLLHTKLKRTAHLSHDRIKNWISDFQNVRADDVINYRVVMAMTKEYLVQGINVIVEQRMRTEDIEGYKKIAKKFDASFFVYQLIASQPLLHKRVNERAARLKQEKKSKARLIKNDIVYSEYRYLHAIELDSEKLSTEKIVNLILKDIKKENAQALL